MARSKYTEEYVRNFLSELGCELLSEYKDVKTNFEFKCSCGETGNATFDSFKNGGRKGCSKCKGQRANEHNKLTFDYVKNAFDDRGYTLLETEYVNSKTKMKFICSNGHEGEIDWNHFNIGQGCKICGKQTRINKQKMPIEEVESFLDSIGFTLLSKYESIHIPLKLICSCGEKVEKSFATIKTTPKCTCISPSKPKNKRIKPRFTDEELVQYIYDYFNKYDRYPTASDFDENPNYPSSSPYGRRYGGFNKLLKKLGIITERGWTVSDEEVLKKYYKYNDIELINEKLSIVRSESTIRHTANALGLQVGYEARWGKQYYTNDEIIELIQEYVEEYGHTPTIKQFSKIYPDIQYSLIRRRFGTWSNALQMAGFDPNVNYMDWTDDDSILLKKMYNDGIPNEEIARYFGYKNPASLIYRLRKEGIELKTRRWTDEELQYLKENYSNESLQNIQKRLSRFNLEDIFTKSSKLGLKRKVLTNLSKIKTYIASDGTECLSFSEYQVTELLLLNNISFQKELYYKDILNNDSIGMLRCDWYIDNIIVEYFGMNSEKYSKRIKVKQNACKKAKQPLISLFHYDLLDDFKGLKNKFEDHGILIFNTDINCVA